MKVKLVGTVPCSMYSILLAHGKMDDPFYRLNEYAARAMSEEDCTLTASFSADEETLSARASFCAFSAWIRSRTSA